ncbi:MAG: hypothetical protein EBR34_15715 [Sphingomonadaceae bacterium]|nr:hypothetical protein [Sphingomonadaceae bacterium]
MNATISHLRRLSLLNSLHNLLNSLLLFLRRHGLKLFDNILRICLCHLSIHLYSLHNLIIILTTLLIYIITTTLHHVIHTIHIHLTTIHISTISHVA